MEVLLKQLIADPEKVQEIMRLAETPYQRYMKSDKGKAAKSRSNAKYANTHKTSQLHDEDVQTWLKGQSGYKSLSELVNEYERPVKMCQLKESLTRLGVPIVPSYFEEGKRVHRKVYALIQK